MLILNSSDILNFLLLIFYRFHLMLIHHYALRKLHEIVYLTHVSHIDFRSFFLTIVLVVHATAFVGFQDVSSPRRHVFVLPIKHGTYWFVRFPSVVLIDSFRWSLVQPVKRSEMLKLVLEFVEMYLPFVLNYDLHVLFFALHF